MVHLFHSLIIHLIFIKSIISLCFFGFPASSSKNSAKPKSETFNVISPFPVSSLNKNPSFASLVSVSVPSKTSVLPTSSDATISPAPTISPASFWYPSNNKKPTNHRGLKPSL